MTKEQFERIKSVLNSAFSRDWHESYYTELSQALTDLYESSLWRPIEARVSELEAALAKQNEIIAKLFEGKLALGARISELEAALASEVAENEALRGG